MASTVQKMLQIDRRIIFIFMALAVIVPVLVPGFILPITTTKSVQDMYDKIESLPEGSTIFISMDFDPTADPELTPQAQAVLKHCFLKKHKVIGMTLWAPGVTLGYENMKASSRWTYRKPILDECGDPVIGPDGEPKVEEIKVHAKEYEDWVYLGFKAGAALVINAVCDNLQNTFPTDHTGKYSTKELELTKNLTRLTGENIDLMIDIAAGAPGVDTWIIYGKEKAGFDMAAGCTGVMATQFYPFLNSGQLVGMMTALKGGAEYEKLINDRKAATRRMASQSIAHLVIIFFVIVGNIAFFISLSKKDEE